MSNVVKPVSAKVEILGILADARAALATALAKLDGHNSVAGAGARSCVVMCDNYLAQNEAWAIAQEDINVR